MAISIEAYRLNIGIYQLSGTKKIKSFKKKSSPHGMKNPNFQNTKPTKLTNIFICAAFYLTLFILFNNSIFNESNDGLNCNETNKCKIDGNVPNGWKVLESCANYPTLLTTWSASSDINKMCHIMFGNKRRNIGYRYFTWNCDRGLLSKNKLEDIKCFAAKHKPNFMGIAEIDFKSDENNIIESSTNTLSTE